MKLILASTSNGRKKVLSTLKIPFEIVDSKIDEDKINPKNPEELVLKRAETKGKEVEKNLPKGNDYLIIAADSMVNLDNKAIGKAKDKNEAIKFLKLLQGKNHSFITGIWIKNTKTGKSWKKIGQSKVTLRKLSNKEIENYANSDDLTKYAGAYSITDSPQNFVTKIEGSITNVIGLPLEIIIPIISSQMNIEAK